MSDNLDTFWSEYNDFNNKNGHSDSDDFISKSKGIQEGNSYLWYQKYSLPCKNVLVFVACRVTSKIIRIDA